MKWGPGVLVLGILAIVGFFVLPVLLENVIYDSPSEANSKVQSSSLFGVNTGAKVSFVGTVKSTNMEMFGYCAMEVDGFGGSIICKNDNYNAGEKVLVNGYVYGYSGSNVVLGSSSWSMAVGSVTPAEVSRPWWNMSVCNMIPVLGIVLIVVGAIGIVRSRKKQGATSGQMAYSMSGPQISVQQNQAQPPYYQGPPPMQQGGQPYPPVQYPPGMPPQYPPQPYQQPMAPPYPQQQPPQYPPQQPFYQPGQYPPPQPYQYPPQYPPQPPQYPPQRPPP